MMSLNRQNLRVSTLRLSAILISLTVLQQCNLSTAATLYKSQDASSEVGRSCQNVCTSPGCTRSAKNFHLSMKPTVDPCDDFYQFVCGGMIDKLNEISEPNIVYYFDVIQSETRSKLRAMMRDVKPDDISAVKKMKIYYQNCLNENRMEAEGFWQVLADPVLNILENIGGWPLLLGEDWNEIDFNWKNAVYKIHNEKFPFFFPVIIIIDRDTNNSTKIMPKILYAATGITKYFFLGDSGEKLKSAYFNLIINITTALGADRDKIYEEVKDILNFEINLYRIEKDHSQEQALEQIKMTVKELSGNYSSIPWLELFNRVFNPSDIAIDDTEFVIIEDPEYLTKLEKLIEVTPKRVLANYLAWEVVRYSLKYMSSEFQKLLVNFLSQLYGKLQSPIIPKKCLSEVKEAFPIAIGAMYVREVFDQSIKDDIKEIVNNIKKQTERNLKQISWIDDRTRKYAVEKLEAISFTIGHVDELMEDDKVNGYYKNLDVVPGSYFLSQLNLGNFMRTVDNKILRHPRNQHDWTKQKSAVYLSPSYLERNNSINIPAIILQEPFFGRDRPQYLNYGAIGSIIGHEIAHAFDSHGRKFDKNGNVKNWWKSDTEEQYLKKARCIIDQYSNFIVDQVQLRVDGDKTQGENIADNGGLRAAYLAYKEWAKTQRVSEECLPNLNYTPQQMFWISAASSWCSKASSEYLIYLIENDVHSPHVARVMIPFSNIKEFAEDFHCKPNSRMNPKEKCVLW